MQAQKELKTALDTIQDAGLDWDVAPEPMYIADGEGGVKTIPGKKAIVRQDTRRVLGTVTDRYAPVQNTEAFSFADALVGPNQAIYESAHSFNGGERVCLKLRLSGDIQIASNVNDVIARYLILTNTHDGKHSLTAIIAPLRLVCLNGMTALGKAESSISIRHTGNIGDKVAEAQRVLGLTVKYYDELSNVYNLLARKTVTQVEVRDFLEKLVPSRKEEVSTRTHNIRNEIEHLFHVGKGNDLPGVRGTAWALLNGVTDFTSHSRSARGRSTSEKSENRQASVWFGSGAKLNGRAFSLVKELANIN